MSETVDLRHEWVLNAHFNFDRLQAIFAEHPDLLDQAYYWSPTDPETAIQAAAHMGNRTIVEWLLAQGAPLSLPTAAMLGRRDDVARLLQAAPAAVHQPGVHQIGVFYHAVLSGDPIIAEMLIVAGSSEDRSFALHAAVSKGHEEMVKWLLEHGANDRNIPNYQGKTPLEVGGRGERTRGNRRTPSGLNLIHQIAR
ncbi:MAG: ankyrin repeat domain-containing protein [Anaerolineae bacterium]|nr:ankyrin repeat domain-containing protein [Anaerolineae bacterium]